MPVWAVWIMHENGIPELWGAYPDIYTARHWVLRKEEEFKCPVEIHEMVLEAA